jgi:L-lactate utilization protein LutC
MEYNILPTPDRLQRTMDAIRKRGVTVMLLETKDNALAQLLALIPVGASVMTGSSVTLKQIGFEELLISGKHPWHNLKDDILAEKNPAWQSALRKQATLADYFLGSVHAIAETGEIVIASATGSQLPAYVYSSPNVLWVAGAQKITPNLETALSRVRDYALPLEDQRLKQLFGKEMVGSIGKLLIFERESPLLHRKVNLILVNEVLGF